LHLCAIVCVCRNGTDEDWKSMKSVLQKLLFAAQIHEESRSALGAPYGGESKSDTVACLALSM